MHGKITKPVKYLSEFEIKELKITEMNGYNMFDTLNMKCQPYCKQSQGRPLKRLLDC